MSILVWVRNKLFGQPTPVESKAEPIVNSQITDAVTQSAPVVSAVATGSLAATATAAAASTTKKPKKPKKSSAAKAKKTK